MTLKLDNHTEVLSQTISRSNHILSPGQVTNRTRWILKTRGTPGQFFHQLLKLIVQSVSKATCTGNAESLDNGSKKKFSIQIWIFEIQLQIAIRHALHFLDTGIDDSEGILQKVGLLMLGNFCCDKIHKHHCDLSHFRKIFNRLLIVHLKQGILTDNRQIIGLLLLLSYRFFL